MFHVTYTDKMQLLPHFYKFGPTLFDGHTLISKRFIRGLRIEKVSLGYVIVDLPL